MNQEPENKNLQNKSSDKEIAMEKTSWAKAAMLLNFAESQPCYLTQEIMQLHILHSNFLQKHTECIKQADICQMFKKACK
jgi:hypothetical protein